VKPLGPAALKHRTGLMPQAVIMRRQSTGSKMPASFVIPPKRPGLLFHPPGLRPWHLQRPVAEAQRTDRSKHGVIAAEDPKTDADLIAVLDQGVLASRPQPI